jgi:hypothetical protein
MARAGFDEVPVGLEFWGVLSMYLNNKHLFISHVVASANKWVDQKNAFVGVFVGSRVFGVGRRPANTRHSRFELFTDFLGLMLVLVIDFSFFLLLVLFEIGGFGAM